MAPRTLYKGNSPKRGRNATEAVQILGDKDASLQSIAYEKGRTEVKEEGREEKA